MNSALVFLSSLLAAALSFAAEPTPSGLFTLKGRITDNAGQPLADVRVGLRQAGVSVQTDASGQFTLEYRPAKPFVKDRAGILEDVEIDKDGFMGRTLNIKDPAFFDQPLNEKLAPVEATADRAEFTTRMGMNIILPPISTDKSFSLIPPEQWQKWFASMSDRNDDRTEQVVFQAYIPARAKKLKAMFLLTRHGIGSIDHPRLRDFADRNSVALVSVRGNPVQRGFYPVSLIDEPVAKLGRMLNHPELGGLPIIAFGHSNGTGFSGIFASQRPKQVIGWISYHSGAAFHLQFPGVEKVPGLALHGMIDPFFKNGQEQTVKHLRQERNAAMAMMIEANVAHGPVDKDQNATWDFIAAFAEAVMRTRINDDGSIRPMVIESGWLGANYDTAKGGQQKLDIASYTGFKGDRATANWLPDKTFAEVWQQYGKTDPRPVR